MVKIRARLYILGLMALIVCNAQADISPVVIQSVYKMGDWRPLPEDKIKSAAVDSALAEISKTKMFAFFTAKQPGIETGSLQITVHLVEEAETATVSIFLQQANGISVSSTHSESLKSQLYDGIYKRFQLAGSTAGKKIATILESRKIEPSNKNIPGADQKRINYLENQIISINNKIIQQSGNDSVRNEAKLEYILSELKSINSNYENLAKKEDIHKQNIKLDKVLDEVGQLNTKIDNKPVAQINVKQNYVIENVLTGQNQFAKSGKSGRDEGKARRLYDQAQEFKQNKEYRKAEAALQQALPLQVSSGLSSLILDELNYALPMFEAQSLAIDLGGNFQSYSKKGKHTAMLNRITTIYKTALKNNQQNFQRTRAIQAALDQHMTTSSAMSAAMSAQSRSNAYTVHQYMKMEYMMEGKYPSEKDFGTLLKRYNLRYKVLSYKSSTDKYSAKLQATAGDVINLSVDADGDVTVD